jgi:hypothetical protein
VAVVALGISILPTVNTPAVVILAAVNKPADEIEAVAPRVRDPPVIAPVPTLMAVAESVPPEVEMFPDAEIPPAVMVKLPLDILILLVVEIPPVIGIIPSEPEG